MSRREAVACLPRACEADGLDTLQEFGPRFHLKNTLHAGRKIEVDARLQVKGVSVVTLPREVFRFPRSTLIMWPTLDFGAKAPASMNRIRSTSSPSGWIS